MKFPLFAALLVAASLVTSCKRVGERMEISELRELSSFARKPTVGVSSATRFFDETKEETTGERQHPLVWTTPEGWTENPPSQMRLIDFKIGPKQEVECYLSAMPGPAGGLAANLNRWRSQMGQQPLSEEEIEKLPRKTLLGTQAHFLSVDGDFKGVGAESAQSGYRMLGLIQQAPELTIFVKMTGPKDLVEKNTAAFEAFCASVQFRKKTDIPMH
jgi:hypothetical protein